MNALAEQVAVWCTDTGKAAAEAHVTTADAAGFVEAESVCTDIEKSPDVHIPLGRVVTKDVNIVTPANVVTATKINSIAQKVAAYKAADDKAAAEVTSTCDCQRGCAPSNAVTVGAKPEGS